jgi:hypothetical protein
MIILHIILRHTSAARQGLIGLIPGEDDTPCPSARVQHVTVASNVDGRIVVDAGLLLLVSKKCCR